MVSSSVHRNEAGIGPPIGHNPRWTQILDSHSDIIAVTFNRDMLMEEETNDFVLFVVTIT